MSVVESAREQLLSNGSWSFDPARSTVESRVDGTGAQARIHAFALKGAGEPATGPESWFYPLDPS
jgi:hypothetical protein